MVAPADAYFAGPPVHIRAATGGTVQVIRRSPRRVVRTYVRTGPVDLRFDGLNEGGREVAGGRYAVRLDGRRIGGFTFHSHVHPIRGRHFDRGGIGVFGAPRNGGRLHEGFDVMAPCGTPLVAARGGEVRQVVHDPALYGHLVIIRGRRTGRNYWYAHLPRRPRLEEGDRVRTGQRIGAVGLTGNAASVGCHLHFEVRRRGRPIDPAPLLHRWDEWS